MLGKKNKTYENRKTGRNNNSETGMRSLQKERKKNERKRMKDAR